MEYIRGSMPGISRMHQYGAIMVAICMTLINLHVTSLTLILFLGMYACMHACMVEGSSCQSTISNSNNYAIAKSYPYMCVHIIICTGTNFVLQYYLHCIFYYSTLIPSLMGIIPVKARAACLHMYTQ